MKSLYRSIMALLIFFSTLANAATHYTECNSCATATSYKSVAESVVSASGTHTVYVLNLSRDEIMKFQVDYEMAEPPAIPYPTFYTAQLPVDNAVNRKFDTLVSARNSLETEINLDIPASVTPSAWNLSHQSFAVNDTIAYFRTNAGVVNRVKLLTAAIFDLTAKHINVRQSTATLTFADGSRAYFTLKLLDLGGSLDLEFIEGIDADNNSIPNQLNDTPNITSFRMTEPDSSGANHLKSALGLIIGGSVSASSGGGSGSGGTVRCVEVDGGYLCTLHRN